MKETRQACIDHVRATLRIMGCADVRDLRMHTGFAWSESEVRAALKSLRARTVRLATGWDQVKRPGESEYIIGYGVAGFGVKRTHQRATLYTLNRGVNP